MIIIQCHTDHHKKAFPGRGGLKVFFYEMKCYFDLRAIFVTVELTREVYWS